MVESCVDVVGKSVSNDSGGGNEGRLWNLSVYVDSAS